MIIAARRERSVALLLSMPVLVWSVDLLLGTPLLILAAAAGPASVFAAVVILLQRGSGRSPAAIAAALAWGALGAAFLATNGNELARSWIEMLSDDDGRAATALLFAPALEEGAKAAGLLLIARFWPASLRNVRDGIVLGALVGIGFVMTENFLYLGMSMLQGGESGLVRAIYVRGVIGAATHATFSACAGAGIGAWRTDAGKSSARREAVAMSLVLAAVAQHMLWNAFAASMVTDAMCGSSVLSADCGDATLLDGLRATLVASAFLLPGIAIPMLAMRHENSVA